MSSWPMAPLTDGSATVQLTNSNVFYTQCDANRYCTGCTDPKDCTRKNLPVVRPWEVQENVILDIDCKHSVYTAVRSPVATKA